MKRLLSSEQQELILELCVNQQSYDKDSALKVPPNFLTVQIHDNQCYVVNYEKCPDGKMEQRQYSILRMIEKALLTHKISNTIFSWCQHDRMRGDYACFSHARLKGGRCVLAPDHTFYGHPDKDPQILNLYSQTYKSLLQTDVKWSNKKEECIFVGNTSNLTNYRRQNTDIKLLAEISMNVLDKCSGDSTFISRESMSESKYLLHLNGHGGAYASRFKYLLGAGSLVIYNINSGPEQNFWQEWWMHEKLLVSGKHYVMTNNVEETAERISFFFKNQELAKTVADAGKSFFVDVLSPDCVEHAWSIILNEYAKRCTFEIPNVIGQKYEKDDYVIEEF